ncbi:MAG: hypothetical protein ACI8RZ_004048 [Myxococcota bacterium]|jgi:hypothetical protein
MTIEIIGGAVKKTAQTAERSPWMEVCARYARCNSLSPSAVAALSAFGGGPPGFAVDFDTLYRESVAQVAGLGERIIATLSGPVDQAQAELFARRFTSVDALLGGLEAPEAAILRVGLVRRMGEILASTHPAALRVRALVDFYYSQAALLHHAAPGLPTLTQLAKTMTWRRVAAGVHHGCIAGRTNQGPLFANVLRVRGGRIAALDCRGKGSLPEILARAGGVAAVSGGFFLYSEPDIAPPSRRTDPVGLLVSGGVVRYPPIFRRSALTWSEQGVEIQEIGMAGVCLEQADVALTILAANDPAQLASGAVSFSRAWGLNSPEAAQSIAVVGGQITAVSVGSLPIPLAGAVIALPHTLPLSVGPVTWRLPSPVHEAMAGGPRLLRGGVPEIDLVSQDFAGSAPPVTFSQDETFDQNLLPRMAAGLCADGTLMLVAIDGRNFDRALGTTLSQTAQLCQALGCVEAMNLDGGSSKRMIIGTQAVDLSSTEVVSAPGAPARVRPVHSGLLVFSA